MHLKKGTTLDCLGLNGKPTQKGGHIHYGHKIVIKQ